MSYRSQSGHECPEDKKKPQPLETEEVQTP